MFIEYILKKGWVMVLFDAVDEVNVEGEQRTKIIQSVSNFVRKYRQNKYMITCRIAASEYSFEGFTDVEIADFNNEQAKTFVARWFTHSPIKGEKFLAEIENTEHRGLKELMQTPLLLALLCIGFEETMAFPSRRAEIYKDAIDALLKKWDTSRAIKRDDVYRGLSFGRKEQMFARIAAAYFDKGDIFFKQNDLAKHIGAFMETLPPVDKFILSHISLFRNTLQRVILLTMRRAVHWSI
ncbi:MAG: hypothetical protein HZB37_02160 [Planctomycetes bacterium]|nr:hypothetical protein [Planctomycetota bacterium]